ncbi:MAG: ribose 5-phosphate isomerase B [bacterium]
MPAPTSADHSKKIIIGSDHGGFELKEQLKQQLQKLGYEVEDVGTFSTESVDYPDFAHVVAQKVAQATDLRGIIVDGAGVGSSIAANKVPGVRAAACQDVYTARNSRAHNNANVLTLGSRVLGPDVATDIVTVWLNTEFEGGRHANRVDKIMDIDRKYRI